MRADIREIKTDNKEIKNNMQKMNTKIAAIKIKQKDNEIKTVTEFLNIRKEMSIDKDTMNDSIAANVLEKIKPVLEEKKSANVNTEDVVKIIEEVLAKRVRQEVKAAKD